MEIRDFTNSDCEIESVGLCGVWEVQGWGGGRVVSGGVRVPNLISSLDIIYSGLKGIRPVFFKTPLNILRNYGNNVGGMEGDKEFRFCNMVNMRFDKALQFLAVRPL